MFFHRTGPLFLDKIAAQPEFFALNLNIPIGLIPYQTP